MRRVTWVSPWYRATCPFCFLQFHPADALLRTLQREGMTLEDDAQVQRYLRLDQPVPMAPITVPAAPRAWLQRMLWRVRLRNDWQGGFDKVCPHCHLPLPLSVAAGESNGRPIAVIGETYSGKSTYFGVLIHQLRHGRVARDMAVSVHPQDTFDPEERRRASSQVLYDRIYGRLYGATPMTPEPTVPVKAGGIYPPLIYRMQFGQRPWWTRGLTGENSLDLVFFDPAGRDMVDQDSLEMYYRYLSQVSGLILLIDPAAIPGVREKLPAEMRSSLGQERPFQATDVVDSIIKLFERFGGYGKSDLIPLPVAVTLAKSDLLRHLTDDPVLFRPSRHERGYDAEDANAVSAAVEAWLNDQQQGALLQSLERFPKRKFCAVSALGTVAEQDQRITLTRNSVRVHDPLFTLLHLMGHLQARRD